MYYSVFTIRWFLIIFTLIEQKEWFNYGKQILLVFSYHKSLAYKYQVSISLEFSVLAIADFKFYEKNY